MSKKNKAMDLTKITDRASCLRALKKLGYSNPGYDFMRGAKLMCGHDMTFQIAPGNFLVTDKQKHFNMIPMLRHIGNTAANANAQYDMLIDLMIQLNVCEEGVVLPIHGLAVGLATLAMLRTEGVIVAITHPESAVEA